MLDAIDALNAADPRRAEHEGQSLPYEVAYSRWLSAWVARLEPAPSDALRIAARGQHVQRFKSPRGAYPEVGLLLGATGVVACGRRTSTAQFFNKHTPA